MERITYTDTGRIVGDIRAWEFERMADFAMYNELLDDGTCQGQLRALWTAYCLHHSLDVDTSEYDNDLLTLWNKMQETGSGADAWEGYDAFDSFMSESLC